MIATIEQYDTLVKAACKYVENGGISQNYEPLYRAVQPFLPPPSIADRLDELSDTVYGSVSHTNMMNKIRALAEEVREIEG